ncbi:MAG: lysylphosphatidylglycerol synthase transmembrane domain-containing protein [Acidimicrobiales bacterium]
MTTPDNNDVTHPEDRKPPLRKRLVRTAVIVAVLVVVFGWLLPQIIDYQLVWDALTSLSGTDLLVLTLLSVLRVPTEAWVYRAMLPGLRIGHGSEAYLSSNVAANVMPPPASSIVQYAYFRADGFDSQASMTGAVGSFVFPQGARIALPIVAFIVLFAAGQADGEALIITTISVVLVGVIAVLLWLVGRSETSARWVGAKLGQFVSWVMTKFHKDPVGDLGDQVVDFRDNVFAIVRNRWPIGLVAVVLNLAITYLILVASLRAVGVEQAQLGLVVIFAAFAVSFFAGVVIPITGSGLGVVDVVMISALSASATGGVDQNVIVAAVVLWRLFYGLLAFFPGALTLTRFSKQNAELLKGASSDFSAHDPIDPPEKDLEKDSR